MTSWFNDEELHYVKQCIFGCDEKVVFVYSHGLNYRYHGLCRDHTERQDFVKSNDGHVIMTFDEYMMEFILRS